MWKTLCMPLTELKHLNTTVWTLINAYMMLFCMLYKSSAQNSWSDLFKTRFCIPQTHFVTFMMFSKSLWSTDQQSDKNITQKGDDITRSSFVTLEMEGQVVHCIVGYSVLAVLCTLQQTQLYRWSVYKHACIKFT